MSVAYKQVHEIPDPPSLKRKDTPRRLEMIILKALKKDKKERYSSIEELLEHLDKVDTNVRTPSISSSNPKGEAETNENYDRRITDRRSGDRRYENHSLFSWIYWIDMIAQQWPLWLIVGILGVTFLIHLIGHP
jgi:hypothetical protein